MTEVLAVGDAIVDAVFGGVSRYPDPGEEVVAPQFDLRPGGSAGYASMGLAALGVEASVAGNVFAHLPGSSDDFDSHVCGGQCVERVPSTVWSARLGSASAGLLVRA